VIVPHLFGTTAFREASLPVALYVVALESLIPSVYRRSRFVAISESTRDDLARRGIAPARVDVVHCGLDHRATAPIRRCEERAPDRAYVGGVRRYKGVDWVMRALPGVLARVPGRGSSVVGDGPYRPALERAARHGVAGAVEFAGFLPLAEKVRACARRGCWCSLRPRRAGGSRWSRRARAAPRWWRPTARAARFGAARRDRAAGAVRRRRAARDALSRVLEDARCASGSAPRGIAWAQRFQWPECARRSLDALLGLRRAGGVGR
jgi:hypothetical protein